MKKKKKVRETGKDHLFFLMCWTGLECAYVPETELRLLKGFESKVKICKQTKKQIR